MPNTVQRPSRSTLSRGACVLLLLLIAAGLGYSGGGEPLDDPLPLKRIVLPPVRIAAELEKARLGLLVPMPREEFEARLQTAAKLQRALANPPRLVQARYVAELSGNALVGRSGVWKVQRDGAVPGVLALPQLNLAIGVLRDAGGEDVLFGDLDGKNLGLWVNKSTDFFFDWSARGSPRADGLVFDLRLPAAATATLELVLPADYHVIPTEGSIPVSGPRDAEDKGKKTWLLQIGGRSQVEFTLRYASESEKTPGLLLSQVQSHVQVWPNWLVASFEFHIDLLHTGARELRFLCDPVLEPFEVTARSADVIGWDVRDEKVPDVKKKDAFQTQRIVTLRFRDPVRGSLAGLRFRCLGNWTAKKWTCPGMALEGGVFRGEALKLTVAPEVQLQEWNAGAFRLHSTKIEEDSGQTLNLVSMVFDLSDRRRPSATLLTQGTEVYAQQSLRWEVLGDKQTVAADCTFSARRGRIQQLNFRLPAGEPPWEVSKVDCEPKEFLDGWRQDGPLLRVDLAKGLAPPDSLRLLLRLSRPGSIAADGATLDFPQVEAIEAPPREAGLQIILDPWLQARVLESSAPPSVALTLAEKEPPLAAFTVHGQKLTGKLFAQPTRSRAAVTIRQHLLLDGAKARSEVDLEVEPLLGRTGGVDFFVTVPGADWSAHANDITAEPPRLERLAWRDVLAASAPFAAAHSLDSLAASAAMREGEWWRVHLPRSDADRPKVSLTASLPKPLGPAWALPLITIPDAERQRGSVRITSKDHLFNVRHSGLQQGPGDESWPAEEGAVDLHYGKGGGLYLATTLQPRGAAKSAAVCDRASWVTYLAPDRDPVHHFRFRLWGWQDSHVSVALAKDAELVAVHVGGHWQKHLQAKAGRDSLDLRIPVAAGAGHSVDVIYRTPRPTTGWLPILSYEESAPQLALAPLQLQRIWRLHPELAPLHQERFQCGSGVDRYPGTAIDLGRFWHMGDALLDEVLPGAPSTSDQALQKIIAAEANVRKKLTPAMQLADAFGALLVDRGIARDLVVDRAAVKDAGLSPSMSLGPSWPLISGSTKPFWEALRLTLVPCRSGLLLTSAERASALEREYGPEWSAAVDEPVEEAVRGGADAGGAFMALLPWLYGLPPGLLAADEVIGVPAEIAASYDVAWREYRPLPGLVQPGEMVVAGVRSLHMAGVLLALVLGVLLFWWLKAGQAAWKTRCLLLGLAALALALVRLPHTYRLVLIWPLVMLAGILLVLYLTFLCRRRPSPQVPSTTSRGRALAGSTAALAIAWLAASGSWAQPAPAEAYPVFLIETEPGKQTALVGPDLLKKLEEIDNKAKPRSNRATLTGAHYKGRWQAGQFEVKASFEIFSHGDLTTLNLPLVGVALKDGALLDGAPVFPVPAPGVKGGLQVPIRGIGMHRLALTFTARVTNNPDSQELRFGIPRVPRSQLELTIPPPLGTPALLACQGEESLRPGPDKTQELRAHLGRESAVHVRFPTELAPGPTATAEVREMYFADLRPLTLSFTGVLQYSVAKGAMSQIAIDLPDGTDVRSVEVLAPPGGVGMAAPALKRWALVGKEPKRQLHIEPTVPLAGKFQVNFSLVWRLEPMKAALPVRLPVPLKVKISESTLAFGLDGVEARETPNNLTYTVITAEQFAKFWQAAGQADPAGIITRALTFRRSSNVSGFTLALTPLQPQALQEMTWTARANHADLAASLHLSAGGEGVALIEWKVPKTIQIGTLRGPALHHWSRKDDLLQVWLQQPQKKLTLSLTGWIELPIKAASDAPGDLNLPVLSLGDAKMLGSKVRVLAAPGWTLEARSVKNLRPLPPVPGAQELRFEAGSGEASALVRVRPSPVEGWARTVTHVGVEAGAWQIHINGRWQGRQDEAGPILLELSDADSAAIDLETSAGLTVTERTGKGARAWSLQPDKTGMQPIHFRLRVEKGLAGKLTVPRVRINGALPRERTLILHGSTPRLEKSDGLLPLKAKATSLGPASAWIIPASRKGPLVVQAPAVTAQPPLEFGDGQQHASLSPEGRWLHQAAYLVRARSAAEVTVTLPVGAQLRAAILDQQPLAARQDGNRYTLAIAGPSGLRRLLLAWEYLEGETLAEPNLTAPSFPDQAQPTVISSVAVPPGWATSFAPAGKELERWLEASLKDPAKEKRATPRSFTQLAGAGWQGPLWLASPGENALHLDLVRADGPRQTLLRRHSQLILVVLFGILILSFLPRVQAWSRETWPEHWIALALFGVWAWGLSFFGVALLAIGLLSRLIWLIMFTAKRVLARWIGQPEAQAG